HRPVLHGDGDGVGMIRLEGHAAVDGAAQGLENGLGEPLALLLDAEDIDPEQVLDGCLAKVDPVEAVLGAGDRLNRGLAGVGHLWSKSFSRRADARLQREPDFTGLPRLRQPRRAPEYLHEKRRVKKNFLSR